MLRPLLWHVVAFWPLLGLSFIFEFIVFVLCPPVNNMEMSANCQLQKHL